MPAVTDLGELVRDAAAAAGTGAASGDGIDGDGARRMRRSASSAPALRRCLANLIDNALKHGTQGGGHA